MGCYCLHYKEEHLITIRQLQSNLGVVKQAATSVVLLEVDLRAEQTDLGFFNKKISGSNPSHFPKDITNGPLHGTNPLYLGWIRNTS